jgi:hypothetical protein
MWYGRRVVTRFHHTLASCAPSTSEEETSRVRAEEAMPDEHLLALLRTAQARTEGAYLSVKRCDLDVQRLDHGCPG